MTGTLGVIGLSGEGSLTIIELAKTIHHGNKLSKSLTNSAIDSQKRLGEWVEEALKEKFEREEKKLK